MKKMLRFLFLSAKITLSTLSQLALFVVALGLIGFFSYLLGWRYLSGNTLLGNDTYSFFTITYWINKFYPNVPFWFPVQGGGMSFTGYPWFAAYIVCTISRFSSLSLVQAFRLLGFLSVPLTGVGIFVFCWARLTEVRPIWMRQVIGLIASLFYIVAPVSWFWMTKWGFYAEQISIVFIPWTFLFFDLFLERLFSKKTDVIFRIGLMATLVFWVLAFLTHFFAGVSIFLIIVLLIIIKFVLFSENRIVLAKRLAIPLFAFFLLFGGLFLFRYYSYSTYTRSVIEGGFGGGSTPTAADKQALSNNSLTPMMMLSLEDPRNHLTDWRFTIKDMRFPFYVWIFVLPSLLFSFFKSKRVFAFSLITVVGFFLSTNVDLYIFISQIPIIRYIGWLAGRISFVSGRFYIPIVAAFGAYVFWELIGLIILYPFKRWRVAYIGLSQLKVLLVLLLTLSLTAFAVFRFYNLPYARTTVNAGGFDSKVIDKNGEEQIIKLNLLDLWGTRARPDQISTAQYTPEQQNFLDTHPEYQPIADYVYLHYLCAFVGPDTSYKLVNARHFISKSTYPSSHICRFYVEDSGPPKNSQEMISLFPPIDQLLQSQSECDTLSLDEFTGIHKYCFAMFPASLQQQLLGNSWRKFSISSDISGETDSTKHFFASLPMSQTYRYDVSGYAAKTLQSTALVNSNSVIQTYIGSLSLIYNSWNYLGQVMYSIFPLYQKPGTLTELGKWFGLNYVYLAGSSLEPFQYWAQDSNWVASNNGGGWKTFTKPTGLTTWDVRPQVLVISDNKKYFYDDSFKYFTQGVLPYDEAIPVKGKEAVDDYSLEELSKYAVIFMRGYLYHSRSKAYSLLDEYVKNGGKLIFDTGWQYYVPDYQISNAPSFMPFDGLAWRSLDSNGQFSLDDQSDFVGIDTRSFGDMKFGTDSWGVSAPTNLRNWGKVILSYNGTPLVVSGDYGQGKVVWIGFNLISHAESKQSDEEFHFLAKLFSFLIGSPQNTRYNLSEDRISPDNMYFTLQSNVDTPSSLYHREAYYPAWKAELETGSGQRIPISVVSAGPGFQLLSLPTVHAGDRVHLRIVTPFMQLIADWISVFTLFILLVYIVLPQMFLKLGIFIFRFFGVSFQKTPYHKHIKHKMSQINILGSNEDEEY